jgi:hypothetical protein
VEKPKHAKPCEADCPPPWGFSALEQSSPSAALVAPVPQPTPVTNPLEPGAEMVNTDSGEPCR